MGEGEAWRYPDNMYIHKQTASSVSGFLLYLPRRDTAGFFETIFANDIDGSAGDIFETNFKIKVDRRDIRDILTEEIPDFDVMAAGFACRPFSIAGKRQGFDDTKGRGMKNTIT